MRYLDPKNDLTFKKIFGEHPHLLKSFLNAVLPLKTPIASLEYLPAEQVPEIPFFKNSIVDVRCTDKKKRQFIIEMQMFWTKSFKSRVLFNASKAYVRQLERGKKYYSLEPVYALSIVNAEFEDQIDTCFHHYKMVHEMDSNIQLKGLELFFIELPKFIPKDIKMKKLGVLWLRFLKEINDQTDDIPIELFEHKDTKEAIQYLQESSFSKAQLEYYDRYWDIVSSERTLIGEALKKGFNEGREEGREVGREEGREVGREEGVGIGEQKKAYKVAEKCLLKGMSIAETAEISELSIEKVQEIAKKIK